MRKLLFIGVLALAVLAGIFAYDAYREQRGPAISITEINQDSDPGQQKAAAATVYIRSVTVVTYDEGIAYHVRPTRAGRLAIGEDLDLAWVEAVNKGVPDKSGLRQQFMCHPLSIVARAKSSWDLETWRPSVGLVRTMLNGCNP